MKKVTAIVLLVGLCTYLNGQHIIEKRSNTASARTVSVDVEFADTSIKTWDKQHVKATATIRSSYKESERYDLEVTEDGDLVQISGEVQSLEIV